MKCACAPRDSAFVVRRHVGCGVVQPGWHTQWNCCIFSSNGCWIKSWATSRSPASPATRYQSTSAPLSWVSSSYIHLNCFFHQNSHSFKSLLKLLTTTLHLWITYYLHLGKVNFPHMLFAILFIGHISQCPINKVVKGQLASWTCMLTIKTKAYTT